MAERIPVGGEYVTENSEGEEVTRNKFWVDVSSSLMNRVTAVAMQEDKSPTEVLGEFITGERDPDTAPGTDE